MTRAELLPAAGRRVLFVSYLFPPVGGVGVHRVTKFVKHLPQFGWNCSVLTVANPSTPLMDGSLRRDIPVSTVVCRARTYEPSYSLKAAVGQSYSRPPGLGGRIRRVCKDWLRAAGNLVLQPDPQILWRPQALREGMQLLREIPHDAIIATGPPFSSLLLGATLARRSGLPLILDYRDEWDLSNTYWENKQHNHLAHALQRRMQASAVRAADVLLATSRSSAQALANTAAAAGSRARTCTIHNGFDSDDFEADHRPAARTNFGNGTGLCRLAFVGTLWNLNPIEPFLEGVLRFAAAQPELASRLELVFAGRRTADQDAALGRLAGTPCRVVARPFVEHDQAIRMMREADALLLLNADKPETHRIINAKTFEYMAARRPMLVVAPEGDLWDIVRNLPGTRLCRPADAGNIARGLTEIVQRREQGATIPEEEWDIRRFERRELAGELAGLLHETIRRFRLAHEPAGNQDATSFTEQAQAPRPPERVDVPWEAVS